MSNEELVQRIQSGEKELLPVLWDQIERFVAYKAIRQLRALGEQTAVEFDDLFNSGYIALLAAAERYDSDRGAKFTTYLALHLKSAFAHSLGVRSSRQQKDPLNNAISLDRPLNEDMDLGTWHDIVADPNDPYADLEQQMYLDHLRPELDKAMSSLKEIERETLIRRYYKGETLSAVSEAMGVNQEAVRQREAKAIRHLRTTKLLERLGQYLECRTNYYFHVGVNTFNNTNTSAVEALMLRRERLTGIIDFVARASRQQEEKKVKNIEKRKIRAGA